MASLIKQTQHLKIQLEAIKSATNDFTDGNCIGKGGFGEVYKGEILHHRGHTMVAFKRLNRAFGQGDPEFWKEIMMLSFYKHENIVSLLGYCDDGGEKILVYEYASKGSLDLYLNSDELTWIPRLKVCIGAARGLAYLHSPTGNQLRVLHRDIKSSNILLDENWDAKISDFGLSKFGPANQQFTFLVSNAVGTIGYCDPLYVETGLLTKESDAYSFGVVLFEVLCGRLCIGNNNNRHRPLTGLARQCYEENRLHEIIHGKIKDEINPKSLKTFTRIAYQCLKREREERPLMTEIVKELETALHYQEETSSTMRGKCLDFGDGGSGGDGDGDGCGEDFPARKSSSPSMNKFGKQPPQSKVIGMENMLGLLRVRIKRGVNLAVRDINTSGLYIVVRMGKQKLKTRVMKRDANPEWNEDLTLAVHDPELPIVLTVYDRHTFTVDDKMGDAEFHLEPFLESLKTKQKSIPSGTVINRIKPSRSNCLAEESCITWRNNIVVQDLCLRLRNVECGEVEIELHWIDIPGLKL